jgi:hypothetical protein
MAAKLPAAAITVRAIGDARELDRWRDAPGLEPVGGRMPADTREVADREGDHEARDREQGQRPPRRRSIEPEVLGKAGEERRLQLVDELQEAVGQCRDGHADDRGEHEELQIAATPQEGQRIGGGRFDAPSLGTRLHRVLTRIG